MRTAPRMDERRASSLAAAMISPESAARKRSSMLQEYRPGAVTVELRAAAPSHDHDRYGREGNDDGRCEDHHRVTSSGRRSHAESRRTSVVPGKVVGQVLGVLISPEAKWELRHMDDGRGWLGPSHAKCNRHAGWEAMIRSQSGYGNGGGPVFVEQPYRWSQRWSDDPPVGTQV